MHLIRELLMIFGVAEKLFKLIFPYWIFGIIVGSCISTFAGNKVHIAFEKINKKRQDLLAIIIASIIGAASPLCMYGTIPLISSLGRKGVPEHLLVSFMISSVLINPNLLIVSFALGNFVAILRLGVSLLAGVSAGILVKIFFRNRKVFNLDEFIEKEKCNYSRSKVAAFFRSINRTIVKTAPYFLIGIFLTAVLDRTIPKGVIVQFFGDESIVGVLIATSLGVPLYLCGGGTVPILKVWLSTGMSVGAGIAFMISGPSTKITNLSAVKNILGIRNFVLYLSFNILFAFLTGIIINFMLNIF